jgi:hypothetical protein
MGKNQVSERSNTRKNYWNINHNDYSISGAVVQRVIMPCITPPRSSHLLQLSRFTHHSTDLISTHSVHSTNFQHDSWRQLRRLEWIWIPK